MSTIEPLEQLKDSEFKKANELLEEADRTNSETDDAIKATNDKLQEKKSAQELLQQKASGYRVVSVSTLENLNNEHQAALTENERLKEEIGKLRGQPKADNKQSLSNERQPSEIETKGYAEGINFALVNSNGNCPSNKKVASPAKENAPKNAEPAPENSPLLSPLNIDNLDRNQNAGNSILSQSNANSASNSNAELLLRLQALEREAKEATEQKARVEAEVKEALEQRARAEAEAKRVLEERTRERAQERALAEERENKIRQEMHETLARERADAEARDRQAKEKADAEAKAKEEEEARLKREREAGEQRKAAAAKNDPAAIFRRKHNWIKG